MEKHICERCGMKGEVALFKNPNFKCLNCGYENNLLIRRELVDLNDPAEGEIVLEIAGLSLK